MLKSLVGLLSKVKFSEPKVVGAAKSGRADITKFTYTKRPSLSASAASKKMASTPTISTKNPSAVDDKLIWMDLEMTGLDISKDTIMEIACIITGPQLDEIARHSEIILHVPDQLLDSMDAWCLDTHGSSGLTEACRKSRITIEEAESSLVDFVTKYTTPGMCPLAGNSIHMDRVFIRRFMPKLDAHLHYRHVDVSTIKELVRRWYPAGTGDKDNGPGKRFLHKTIADIEDSINELRYYRSLYFKEPKEIQAPEEPKTNGNLKAHSVSP